MARLLMLAALLACSFAAEIITKDGNIVLIVDSPSQTVSIATKAEHDGNTISAMNQAITMVRVVGVAMLLMPLFPQLNRDTLRPKSVP